MIFGAVLALCVGQSTAQPPTAGKPGKHAHRHGKRKVSWKKKGQQGIKSDRATEIQQALIRENYLTGEPSGVWDSRTQSAMVRYQADHGWQTKEVPDSRALIKLGLGPDYSSQTLVNGQLITGPGGATSTAASRSISSGATDKR